MLAGLGSGCYGGAPPRLLAWLLAGPSSLLLLQRPRVLWYNPRREAPVSLDLATEKPMTPARVPILTGRRWLYLMDWMSRHTGDPGYRKLAVAEYGEDAVVKAVDYYLSHPDEYGHDQCCGGIEKS